MNTTLRIFIAALVAPLVPFLLLIILGFVTLIFAIFLSSEPVKFIDFIKAISMAAFSLQVSYPATLIIGIPTHLFLRLMKRNTVRFHAIAGCIYSAVIPLLMIVEFAYKKKPLPELELVIASILFCIVIFIFIVSVSTAFGMIAKDKVLVGDTNVGA